MLIDDKSTELEDLKLNLNDEDLSTLIGADVFEQLQSLFNDSYDEIVIRRCSAHGKFINFHTDVSLKTLQVAVNDDYEGGRLVYLSEGQMHTVERPAGSITIHHNEIVHGVTTLTAGTRYGLFLLKKKVASTI